ncbi:alanyl-tRNA editing protein [Fusobacterium simiae]|uniref:Alanyl-tRNA editing protein n=1 Tax=Fusobacterium simiae TaxID=855 RepID=A0ABT4DGE1_FUSSI|nr:alanyl-tRNA editing protein [Fusobacterium simiae]MCY7007657.1 alanyl-tRNA editing protein [Fusobacterium simiae]
MESKKINIKRISDKTYEVLNSPFYIDGKGGQLGDRGTISDANIIEVKENLVILDKDLENGEYSYLIDKKRREDIRQQHTAQHIFSAEAYNKFGLNTVGFRMAEGYTTVDLDQKDISKDIIEKLEELVNDDIKADIVVEEEIYTNEEAHKIENLRKAIKDKIKGDVRFIKIGDIDICACAGFHVSRTSEIEIFKLINHENIKGNYTRFYFLAGDRAKADYNKKHDIIKKLTNIFSCKDDEIIEMVDKFLKEKINLTSELKSLSMKYAELMAKDFEKTFIEYKGHKILVYNEDENLVSVLPRFIDLNKFLLLSGFDKNFSLNSNVYDCKEIISNIVKTFPTIKGGGGKNKGNIKLDKAYSRNELIELIKKGIDSNNEQ